MARNILMGHIAELPIQRAFKQQPKNLQTRYGEFKRKWLAENDLQRTTEPAFNQAQKKNEKSKDDGKDDSLEDLEFKKLDQVRQTL